jgi:hypothetical protein
MFELIGIPRRYVHYLSGPMRRSRRPSDLTNENGGGVGGQEGSGSGGGGGDLGGGGSSGGGSGEFHRFVAAAAAADENPKVYAPAAAALDLHVSRLLAELHGGEILVKALPPMGNTTAVIIRIPVGPGRKCPPCHPPQIIYTLYTKPSFDSDGKHMTWRACLPDPRTRR